MVQPQEIHQNGDYINLFRQAYELVPYGIQSTYYKLFSNYVVNNKLKRDFINVVLKREHLNWQNIEHLLQFILQDPNNDIFLKPSTGQDTAPKSLMELTNQVNREGYYLLLSRSSITIFLRNQNDINDNQRNGIDALRNLCSQLNGIANSELYKGTYLSYFTADVEEFVLRQIKEPKYINFFSITEKLISNNIILLFNNLEMLTEETEQSIHLSSFKQLFLLKLLEVLRYGNVTKGVHDPTILQSIFYRETRDLSQEEGIKDRIKNIIRHLTQMNPDLSSSFPSIINSPNASQLIRELGFDLNLFSVEVTKKYSKAYKIIDDDDDDYIGSPLDKLLIVPIMNPTIEQMGLNNFLNEVCLGILNSCFHDSCLILTDDRNNSFVVDFQQIAHYQLSIEKHCSLQSLSIGLSTKKFLELLLEISTVDEVLDFLKDGCIVWPKIRSIFSKIVLQSEFQFHRILVCQEGLVNNEDPLCAKKIYSLENTASVEMFPNGGLSLGTYFSDNTLLISVQNGKMRRVVFDELIVSDTSSTTNIDESFVIY